MNHRIGPRMAAVALRGKTDLNHVIGMANDQAPCLASPVRRSADYGCLVVGRFHIPTSFVTFRNSSLKYVLMLFAYSISIAFCATT